MELLKGKTILITGISGEIGSAAASLFAEAGAEVVGTARDHAKAAGIIDSVAAKGGKISFIGADITDDKSVSSLFEAIKAKHSRLDGAFNTVGIQQSRRAMPDISANDLDQIMGVNARGTFLCLQHELRIMVKQGGAGSVVNLSSIGGMEALRHAAAYCASKFGVQGMTRTAALDVAEAGVRVNSVCAGAFGGHGKAEAGAEKLHMENIPMKRVAEAKEIAALAMFLLSDHAAYITGQSIAVDGGVTAGLLAV
ncbi:SDR family NAD(P)-dependent oxidoreductase [Sphingomonadaceae bacterium G21617-S1]|nr:SDR family NAD(P)-dependent oxidoreductase [Sphingomonadaceae bacterium G21617-S1]